MKLISYKSAVCFFFAILAMAAAAQDAEIDAIRQIYYGLNARIQRALTGDWDADLYCNEIQTNSLDQPWRAVGKYQVRARFWYNEMPEFGEPDTSVLLKVEISEEIANHVFYTEFVFHENALIFCFKRDVLMAGENTGEYRYYFAGEALIRYQKDDKITGPEQDAALAIVEEAYRYRDLFLTAYYRLKPQN